jgi:hypothetical protein
MYTESRKIQLIEQVLKLKNETILTELEAILGKAKNAKPSKKSAHDFVGLWDKKDAILIEKAIEEGCEQIHADYWK